MSAKVIKAPKEGWRPFQFPPRSKSLAISASSDPESIQRAISEGFQESSDRGFQQGLLQGKEQGYKDGYAQGQREGHQLGLGEGKREGRQLFEQASQPLDDAYNALQTFLDDYQNKRDEQLLELVRKVSENVIRCELTLNPTQLMNLANEALAALPDQQNNVRIHMNPKEFERIRAVESERTERWRLVPDESMAMGECRIITDETEVDVGCQQRLDACMDALIEHVHVEGL